jgi:hypothetical protein
MALSALLSPQVVLPPEPGRDMFLSSFFDPASIEQRHVEREALERGLLIAGKRRVLARSQYKSSHPKK